MMLATEAPIIDMISVAIESMCAEMRALARCIPLLYPENFNGVLGIRQDGYLKIQIVHLRHGNAAVDLLSSFFFNKKISMIYRICKFNISILLLAVKI